MSYIEMTDEEKELYDFFIDGDLYNGPDFRGAPYPPLNPGRINAQNIPDNMRLKGLDRSYKEKDSGDEYRFQYRTQEPFNSDDAEVFFKEIESFLSFVASHYELERTIDIIFEVWSRDGKDYGYSRRDYTLKPDVEYFESLNGGESSGYYNDDVESMIRDLNVWLNGDTVYTSNKDGKVYYMGGYYGEESGVFDTFEEFKDCYDESKEEALHELFWSIGHRFEISKDDIEETLDEINKLDLSIESKIEKAATEFDIDEPAYKKLFGEYFSEPSTEYFESLEENSPKEEIIYFGFEGGEGGNYCEGDYVRLMKHPDNTYTWIESEEYIYSDKSFKTREEAIQDIIYRLTPDDGSIIHLSKDPDELYDEIMGE